MAKTNKRELIYKFIIDHTADNGYAPTIREICSHLGITSTSAVHYHIECLRREGKLQYSDGKSRSITTVAGNYTNTPLVGKISAGQGCLAIENIESYMPLPTDLYGHDESFLLKVDGDSMIECGISHGDFVVVRKQDSADIGDIVVVFWDDIATVKRLASITPLVLHPENSTMQDIHIDNADTCMIIGKVIGCLKQY